MSKLNDLAETARRLSLSRTRVWQLRSSGELLTVYEGCHPMVSDEAIDAYLASLSKIEEG